MDFEALDMDALQLFDPDAKTIYINNFKTWDVDGVKPFDPEASDIVGMDMEKFEEKAMFPVSSLDPDAHIAMEYPTIVHPLVDADLSLKGDQKFDFEKCVAEINAGANRENRVLACLRPEMELLCEPDAKCIEHIRASYRVKYGDYMIRDLFGVKKRYQKRGRPKKTRRGAKNGAFSGGSSQKKMRIGRAANDTVSEEEKLFRARYKILLEMQEKRKAAEKMSPPEVPPPPVKDESLEKYKLLHPDEIVAKKEARPLFQFLFEKKRE